MFDFVFAYFFFFVGYPFVLASMVAEEPILFIGWLIVAIVGVWSLFKKDKKIALKLFLCIWVMPGTVVCGAASIAPWIMTIHWAFDDNGCSNLLSLTGTFVFNLVIVFGTSKLVSVLKSKRKYA